MEGHTIDLMRVRRAPGEEALQEHVEAGDSQAFRAVEGLLGSLVIIGPCGAGTGVKKDGDEEEVDETSANLLGGRRVGGRFPLTD